MPSYRWISSSRAGPEGTMQLSFSVPITALPVVAPPVDITMDTKMDTSTDRRCMMPSCNGAYKYRLVRDDRILACGMQHLKALKDYDFDKGFRGR